MANPKPDKVKVNKDTGVPDEGDPHDEREAQAVANAKAEKVVNIATYDTFGEKGGE